MTKQKKTLAISIAVVAVLLAIMIAVTVVASTFPSEMNQLFGYGPMKVEKVEGSENWEGNYVEYDTKNADEAFAHAQEVNLQIAAEGIVMLKNEDNALPLEKGSKVTLLGTQVAHHVTAPTDDANGKEGSMLMYEAFDNAGFDVNEKAWNWYSSFRQVNDGSSNESPSQEGYAENVASTYGEYGDGTAVVLFRRSTSEGADPSTDMGANENHRTQLSLSASELDLLVEACTNFKQVVVLISSPNTMELAFLEDGANYTDPYTGKTYDFSKIKGAFWIGGLGLNGPGSLAKICSGEINPSGHFVDTYIRDLKSNPAMVNYGLFEYTNTTQYADEMYGTTGQQFTVEYEEGIYVGYKYWETAAYEASRGNYDGFDYDKSVIYPFGYGLSYTDFTMALEDEPTYDSAADEYVFNVKVTNTGKVAGKEVVQIYVSAPFDYNAGAATVEKSHVALCGFGKTGSIPAGQSETIEIRVQRDYIASYDYITEKAYILDAGDYTFYISDNAHAWAEIDAENDGSRQWTMTLDKKVVFTDEADGKRTTDEVAAVNAFDRDTNWKFRDYTENTVGSGYASNFTRRDFAGSYPTAPEGNDLVANDYLIEAFKKYDLEKDYSSSTNSPYKDVVLHEEEDYVSMVDSVADNTVTLVEMRGADFDDERWDTLINQLNLDELTRLYTQGGWADPAIESISAPAAIGTDSPSGIAAVMLQGSKAFYPYCAEVLLCSTWNTEMAALYGDSLAEDAQAQRSTRVGQSLNYIFGGGANTHRIAFGGRNHEYFSEDGFIAGKMAASEASAAGQKGLVMLFKHCALNEQETARQGANGSGNQGTYTSFVNEQAIREIYMRPWEIYTKEATRTVRYYNADGEFESKEMSAASAIMTSYNRVGGVWSGCSPIVTVILRQECGFEGISFTDAGGTIDGYMNSDFGLRTGGTTSCLMQSSAGSGALSDPDSNTTIYYLREAAHYKLYQKANSNQVLGLVPGQTISYGMAPWQIAIVIGWVVTGVLAVGAVVLNVLAAKRGKGNK